MCMWFFYDDSLEEEVWNTVQQIDAKIRRLKEYGEIRGDVRPTDTALSLKTEKDSWQLCRQKFGFACNIPGERSEGNLVINARSETILQKPLFAHAFEKHRVIIPATGFFEWNSRKEKSKFTGQGGKVLYFAGCYQKDSDQDRFVILTTQANASMASVHDRMPLILEREEISDWLNSEENARRLLSKQPGELVRTTEYEQMSLFG